MTSSELALVVTHYVSLILSYRKRIFLIVLGLLVMRISQMRIRRKQTAPTTMMLIKVKSSDKGLFDELCFTNFRDASVRLPCKLDVI